MNGARGEPREALSENGKGQRAAGFRNRKFSAVFTVTEGEKRLAERVFLWGDRHDKMQPQHAYLLYNHP